MDIQGKVYCFFEQSGTFKNEFLKLQFVAQDVDIQNVYGETDIVVDLFSEIDKAYDNQLSIFDTIYHDDLIIAFFPCIYFCATSGINFSWNCRNYRKMKVKEKSDTIIARDKQRSRYFQLLIKLFTIVKERDLRMIVENPWNEQTYLKTNFILPPTFVDKNRRLRGDYFVKPTAYWFVNCIPTSGQSYQSGVCKKVIEKTKSSKISGMCSPERSMMSPDYARNFICDFILGKQQYHSQPQLF